MHRVARDDMVRYVEFFQQLLHGGDFVGFFVDLDMRQHQRRVDGERAEHLSCLDVIEAIETALERLAIERHDPRAETGPGPVQVGCMFAKDLFNIRRAQPLQNIPDRSVRGRPLPADLEDFVQLSSVDFDEGADAAIRVGAAHNRQNGKQQDLRQLIKFAFGPPAGGGGRSTEGKLQVAAAVELQGKGPGRVRLAVIKDASANSLRAFLKASVTDGATIKTDGWSGYPGAPGLTHEPHVVGKMAAHIVLPWVHRIFSNLKTWALGVYHGLRKQHLQTYLDEFVFRFNRRRTPHAAFRTLLGIGFVIKPVTYKMLIAADAEG